MTSARETALTALYKIENDGAYANLALKEQLAHSPLSEVDKKFVTALVYGTVQRKNTLIFLIDHYSKLKLKKISKFIQLIIMMGMYQILYMDKVPESAAVNESVKLARRYGHASSAGFVNGLLRTVIRNRDNLPVPQDFFEALAVRHSLPVWLVQRWVERFGVEFAEALMDAMNREAGMSLRVNTLKTSREEVISRFPEAVKSEISADGMVCRGFDVANSREFAEGLISVQDQAAMLTAHILAPKPGETVMDLCAAPGGKSAHIAQLMENKGKILSFDIHAHKIQLIAQNANRLGIDIIHAELGNSAEFCAEYEGSADRILADVPCSGLGIIRRKPDIKWNRQADFDLLRLQYAILENAARYLKDGGELVYSTCTLEPEENEKMIEKFLSADKNFTSVDINPLLPERLRRETAEKGMITLYPHLDDTDGFFIAKLKKGVKQ